MSHQPGSFWVSRKRIRYFNRGDLTKTVGEIRVGELAQGREDNEVPQR